MWILLGDGIQGIDHSADVDTIFLCSLALFLHQ